ncbi:MAG: PEGA domain-containing protein [Nitrospirae bacterium]|nr:PEGA domain-containing protein [Nitrospirota bacterium]
MKNCRIWQGGLVLCALVGGLSGCGSWMHSDKQSVTIFTNPPEASVVIDDYLHLTAPGTVTLSRKGNHLAQVKKEGFQPTFFKIDRTWSWWVLGDIFGCLVIFSPICIMNDMDQGGYYTFDDKIYLTLDRLTGSEPAPSK